MAVFHDPNLLKKNQQNGLYESTTGKQNSYSSGSFQPVYRDPELEGGKSVVVNPMRGGIAATSVPKPANNYTSSGKSNSSGTGSGSGSNANQYQTMLDDLYNKVMGYGGYSYTPYTPSVYDRTVDTSATEAALKAALGDIQGYGDFQYDLNGDLLYQQAVDNYAMLGQQAMADATANAAGLTGGYGNSYAAQVGNQAYQQYLTQANNMIPQFQQMAMNVWQSGLDRRMGVYDAVSQQLANELSLEDMYFNIWAQNEANAANAHSMNSQGAYDSWLAGYNQLMDQYNLAKDYYATLEALNKSSGNGGGSSSSSKTQSANTGSKAQSTSNKTSSTTTLPTVGTTGAMVGLTSPLDKNGVSGNYFKKLAELLKK